MLEYPIQKIETSTCGPFQIYFSENLFFPNKISKLHNYKKVTSKAIETLLNELLTLDRDKNRQIIKEDINERQIKMT